MLDASAKALLGEASELPVAAVRAHFEALRRPRIAHLCMIENRIEVHS